jgi:hypothetical protein
VLRTRELCLAPSPRKAQNALVRTSSDFPDELLRQEETKAVPLTAPSSRQRSELPVARPATGRSLPALADAEVQRILDEEEASGDAGGPSGAYSINPTIGDDAEA